MNSVSVQNKENQIKHLDSIIAPQKSLQNLSDRKKLRSCSTIRMQKHTLQAFLLGKQTRKKNVLYLNFFPHTYHLRWLVLRLSYKIDNQLELTTEEIIPFTIVVKPIKYLELNEK